MIVGDGGFAGVNPPYTNENKYDGVLGTLPMMDCDHGVTALILRTGFVGADE
jgi:hypothetical protein